jgi:hypothetical protein
LSGRKGPSKIAAATYRGNLMSARIAVLLSGVALLATAAPSFAIEPEDAADALVAALTANSNGEGEYEAATLDGSNVTITGLTLSHGAKAGSTEKGDSVTFAETVIEAPSDESDGVFDSPRITFSNGTLSGEANGTLTAASLTEVTVLDPEEVKSSGIGQALTFHTAEANGLTITRPDKPGSVTVERIMMETGNVVDNVPQDNKGEVTGIALSPEIFADSGFTPQTIGYDNMVFSIRWDGSRDAATKAVTVRDFTLGMQDGGELGLSGMFSDLPDPNALNDADASAKAAAMKVHNLTLRYKDSSLAGRILDYLAKQQGIGRAEYSQQIAGALPFLLASLNNPTFQNQVSSAAATFLQDPKSITVKIEPKEPITGGEIMGIVGSAPQTLPDRLNVSITANAD